MFRHLSASAFVMLCLVGPLPGQQQVTTPGERLLETRAELEERLAELDATTRSTAYSSSLRRRARDQAELIRSRLEQGDFRSGDRVFLALSVRGQALFRDTLTVSAGPELFIQSPDGQLNLPPIGLPGVLRSELGTHLGTELGRYLREPSIDEVTTFIRLTVVGDATNQGQVYFPATSDIGSAIGSQGPTADIDKVTIRRGSEVLYDEDAVRQAFQDGRTLDQLSLQAGDEIRIPARTPRQNWLTIVQITVGLLTAIGFAYQIFGR